jgi:hypothetical protein
MTLSIITLSKMTQRHQASRVVMLIFVYAEWFVVIAMLSVEMLCHVRPNNHAECHYTECRYAVGRGAQQLLRS